MKIEQSAIVPYLFVANPDVVILDENEDGGLLFNPDTSKAKMMNPTGLFIWENCLEPQTIESLISLFSCNYTDVPRADVLQDIKGFLDELIMEGFIGIVEINP